MRSWQAKAGGNVTRSLKLKSVVLASTVLAVLHLEEMYIFLQFVSGMGSILAWEQDS